MNRGSSEVREACAVFAKGTPDILKFVEHERFLFNRRLPMECLSQATLNVSWGCVASE